jgi:hypothetical protein
LYELRKTSNHLNSNIIILSFNREDKMNHTATTKNLVLIGMLAAITAALTGTVAISIQNAAAQTTDLENSGTNSKFKQKEKNNCSGFTFCCNVANEFLPPHLIKQICPPGPPPVPIG